MKTKIYTTIDNEVIEDWWKLWEKSPYANYTNAPQWFLAVKETFTHSDYVIVALYEEKKLVAVGALVKEKKYGIDVYTIPAENYVCGTPFLFIRQDKKIIKTIVENLSKLGTVFLANIPDDFVTQLNISTIKMDAIRQTVNYYLPLVKDEKGIAIIPNKKKLLHKIRDMEERFIIRTTDGTTNEPFSAVFSIDIESRKQQKGYSTFTDSKAKDLFISLAKHFKEHLWINILYFDKKPIAYEIGFAVGKKYFGNQISYIANYMQYSPGKVMIARLIEKLISSGLEYMDLGSGDSSIKRGVTKEKRDLYQVVISKNKMTRMYISRICQSRNYLFDQLHQRVKIYSTYRKIRSILPL